MTIKNLRWLSISGIIVLLILLEIPISQIFIGLLLGLLIAPPVFVLVSVSKEGIPVMIKELENLLASGKEFLLISISKESIILEPEFR